VGAAWIAVIGTLGGVLVAGALSVVGEQMRGRREERLRAQEHTLAVEQSWRQACVALGALTSEVWSRSWALVDYREADPEGWREDAYVQGLQDALEATLGRLNEAYSELRILGTLSFGEEMNRLYDSAVRGAASAFAETPEYPEPGIGKLLDAYLAAVSVEFSLSRAGRAGIALAPGPRHANEPSSD
jgi:hypothetical protein